MARKSKKKKKVVSTRAFHNKVMNLVKRYGKVRMVFRDGEELDQDICDCMCKKCIANFHDIPEYDYRRRLITKSGEIRVSYKSNGHKHWSRYTESCFMDEYVQKHARKDRFDGYGQYTSNRELQRVKDTYYTPKISLKLMAEHDNEVGIFPVAIEYGPRFKRSIEL